MAAPYDRASLEASIESVVYLNTTGEIDGDELQGVLLDIVDSCFNLLDETPLTAGDAFIGAQIFTSTGTYTPTSGARKAIIIGAAGGGGRPSNVGGSSSGGGSGGCAIKFKDLTGVSSLAVTVGAGGSTSGGSGGTTSVGSDLSVGGGGGGATRAATAGVTLGGSGGTATTGDILLPGATGDPSFADGSNYVPGNGGRTPFFGHYGAGANGANNAGGGLAGNGGFVLVLEFG